MRDLDRCAAVILLTGPEGTEPLFLARVMGAPLLRWLADALARQGVRRFFLACPERFLSEAGACLPADCICTACASREAAGRLRRALQEITQESLIVLTAPCLYLPDLPEAERHPACAYRVRRAALQAAAEQEAFSLGRFLQAEGACAEGFCGVPDRAALAALQPALKRAHLRALAAQGVEIWDADSCFIDPGVRIGPRTAILPGTIVRGTSAIGAECVIGPQTFVEHARIGSGCHVSQSHLCGCHVGSDCVIGPYATLRPGTVLDSRVRIGACTELRAASIREGTRVGALCSLRELDCGRSCTIGAGCLSAAGAPEPTGRIVLGDDALLGGGATLAGPVEIGRSAAVAAGATIAAPVPAQALATARGRQTTRRDWALYRK